MSIPILQAKRPKVNVAPASPEQRWGVERDGVCNALLGPQVPPPCPRLALAPLCSHQTLGSL